MSDLLGSLTSAARALEAQRLGLEATGQNIANVNTAGYTRRVVDFQAVAPSDRRSVGGGVDASSIRALRDRLMDRRLHQELPAERRQAAIADSLSVAEVALGMPGQSLDGRLTAFFDSFSRLAESPTSAVARQEVLLQGQSLAGAFRDMAQRFDIARRDADRSIVADVETINGIAQRLASLNVAMSGTTETGALHLADEQSVLVRQLAELIDVDVVERSTGGVDVMFGNGRALVIGSESYAIAATPTGPSGLATLTTGGVTVTGEITGGRLGGLLQVRDVNLPAYLERLDTLAYETVQRVNTLHTAGYDQTGAAAGDFFAFSVAPAGVAGAARGMIVDAAVAADVRLIAAGSTNESGDNGTARSIASLRDTRVLDGGTATLHDGWGQLVYRVGRDAQVARQEQRTRADVVRQVDALRDQTSGVSLDEEAMQMLKFQRAYEANARFFRVIDQALETLLQTVGR